jgi:hypothetical protein
VTVKELIEFLDMFPHDLDVGVDVSTEGVLCYLRAYNPPYVIDETLYLVAT